jgi:hypothetical protein
MFVSGLRRVALLPAVDQRSLRRCFPFALFLVAG